jgi:hypothetical protein
VEHLLKAGYTIVVDADLRSYFDTIPRERMIERSCTRTKRRSWTQRRQALTFWDITLNEV